MQTTLTEINGRFKNVQAQIIDWPEALRAKLGKLKKSAFLATPRHETQGKLPLIVSLHGAGGKTWTLNEQLARSAQVKGLGLAERAGRDLILLEPNSDDNWDPQTLNLMLDYVLDQYPQIDHRRIYVMGHSMGGQGTWSWILQSPERFAAAAPCGFGGGSDSDPIERILKLPLWAMVGGSDEKNVLKVQAMVDKLRAAGHGNVGYTAFPGANHAQANAAVFSSVDLVDWMLTHAKSE